MYQQRDVKIENIKLVFRGNIRLKKIMSFSGGNLRLAFIFNGFLPKSEIFILL